MSDQTPEAESEEPPGDGYRRLVDGLLTHPIFGLDADGRIVAWSDPARRLYGRDEASVRGESVETLFAAAEQLDRPVAAVLVAARDGSATTDRWHERADGSVVWGTLTLEPLCAGTEGGDLRGYAAVVRDTTDRKQYERTLERQNDRLKELTDILARDLRSPLSVIEGRLDLYRETGDDDHIAAVEATTDRMERLVDDLLRVARQGDVVADPEATDVGDVVETAWEGVEAAADGTTLEYETVGAVSADADRLCQLFENLFRNAVEHAGPDVTVRVSPLEGGLYVEDDGPGVPEDRREGVFDHGVSTNDDGSGYGLSIVRTIATAHGWDVLVTAADAGGARLEFSGIENVE